MSFFAGNGKLHITSNQRSIGELNSNTIYPDTVFHSNMQSLCSLGEYQSQASPITFSVNGQTEYAFEASIPNEVRAHLLDNKVVLVQMGNISTSIGDSTPKESAVAFPINIKVGSEAGIMSDNKSYSVAISPQVTAGGLLDISYSVNQLANRAISVNSFDEGGRAGTPPTQTSNINGWSTDPDYSPGGKVTNLLRPSSNFVQYHARGLRWRLSDYTITSQEQSRTDFPYMTNLDGIQAPIFTFIVLNARFVNNIYEFIPPLAHINQEGIVLEGDNLSINGTKFNSVKIIQSTNPHAVGTFTLGKYVNRLLPTISYTNTSIYAPTSRQYKKWSMVNYTQGAKCSNGLLNFMAGPGTYEQLDCWYPTSNGAQLLEDSTYTAHIAYYFNMYNQEHSFLAHMGYPLPGYILSNRAYYKRRSDTLLFADASGSAVAHGYRVTKTPFALLDTRKFTSMYITKDGISGEYFDGTSTHVLPIWNTASPPTHMITGTRNISFPDEYASATLVDGVFSINVSGDIIYMGLNREEESFLIGCKVGNFAGTDLRSTPHTFYGENDYSMMVYDDKMLSNMHTSDGAVQGVVKLRDGEEIVMAQMYLQVGNKSYQELPHAPPINQGEAPRYNIGSIVLVAGVFVMYTIKREGNSIRRYTRAIIDSAKDERVLYDGEVPASTWVMNNIYIPRVDSYVVRIQ